MRKDRSFNQMREISFEKNVNIHADGSCLVKFGNTHVLCLATIDEKVPHWLKNTGKGWVTAEYGMLPRSTNTRMDREAAKGKQSGRTQEIQRLIGRSLRSIVDLSNLGERQIKIDCDVIQADGGTRTASISGGFVALFLAVEKIKKNLDRLLEQQRQEEAARQSAAAAIQQQNREQGTGGYQSDFASDSDFMEGSGTSAEMGSFALGGIVGIL